VRERERERDRKREKKREREREIAEIKQSAWSRPIHKY
jgi:hypothetical protein